MKKVLMFPLTVVLVLAIPAFAVAQMHGGAGHHMMGSGMSNNMGMMSGMMGDMHQMMQ